MTENEAIKILQGAIKKPNTKDGYLGQAVTMAIQALKENQRYHAIGTVEEFKALKEKAEPKKIIDKNYNLNTSTDLDKLLGQKPDYEIYPGCGYDRSWCG